MKRMPFLWALLVLLALAAPASAAAQFQDVPSTHWAAADIALCVEQGFFAGQTAERFGAGEPMTRAAFTVALCRFFGWETEPPTSLPFQDTDTSAWYAPALAAAYREGAVTVQTTQFRPGEPITRGELAATMVRALGYRSISGLTGASPFQDVSANTGYITLAYDLGLMNGNRGYFLPNQFATRDQTAAVLARLYRKLHGPAPQLLGVSRDGLALSGLNAAAVQTGHLTIDRKVKISYAVEEDRAEALRSAARDAGVPAFLAVTGNRLTWDAVTLLAEAAEGYDGLLLELTAAAEPELLQALREKWTGTLVLVVPAALANGELARMVDTLAVSVSGDAKMVGGFPSDPVEPLENIYTALRTLKEETDAGRLALYLTTSGHVWSGYEQENALSGREIESLLSTQQDIRAYYSDRYACAYLRVPEGNRERVVWYLNDRAVAARVQLLRLMDVGQIILSDADGMAASVWSALRP